MAVIRLDVRIGAVTAPDGARIDRDDLCRRVEAALAGLLAREPLRVRGGEIALPAARVRAASASSAASVAYAVARQVHAELRRAEAAR